MRAILVPVRKLVASRFGSIIASGWHVASVVMRDFVDNAPFCDTPLLGLKIDDFLWRLAARRGNVLYITRKVIDIARLRSKPDRRVLTMRMTVTNQDGVVVMSFVKSDADASPARGLGPQRAFSARYPARCATAGRRSRARRAQNRRGRHV